MVFNVFITPIIFVLNFISGRESGTDHRQAGDVPTGDSTDGGPGSAGHSVSTEQLRAADAPDADTVDDDDIISVSEGQAEGAGGHEVDIELEEEEVANDTGIGVMADVSAISVTEAGTVGVPVVVRTDTVPGERPRGAGHGLQNWTPVLRRLEWPATWRCDPGQCVYCTRAERRRELVINEELNHLE